MNLLFNLKQKYLPYLRYLRETKKLLTLILLLPLLLSLSTCAEKAPFESQFDRTDITPPVFSPSPDSSYFEEQHITLSHENEEAVIRYTTDGSTPNDTSAVYTEPIEVSRITTIKAFASLSGWDDSEVAAATYTLEVSRVTFNPPGDVYDSPLFVELNCDTPNSIIRYVNDESMPDSTSAKYTEPIYVYRETYFRAIASREGWKDSFFAESLYSPSPLPEPTFEPPAGIYRTEQQVTINCDVEDAIIRFTTDGSEPDTSSQLYTEPVAVAADMTLKARAFKQGWVASDAATASYTITGTLPAPEFNPPGGNYYNEQRVTITCDVPNAEIRYTTDGSVPTQQSSLYSQPIKIASNTTAIKAKAFKQHWDESSISKAAYSFTVADPVVSLPPGNYATEQTVSINCDSEDAVIRYTTNGSNPDQNSEIYQDPIEIDRSLTLRVRAFRDNWTPSQTISAEYTLEVVPPSFKPPPGSYDSEQYINIKPETDDSYVRYTTDGSEPSPFADLFTEPFKLTEDTVIKAKAYRTGWETSSTSEASYIFTTIPPANGDGSLENPYQIASLPNLRWIALDETRWSYHYLQISNIDASETRNTAVWGNSGWIPLGNNTTRFSGSYNGGHHTIEGLFINNPTGDNIGLFGYTNSATIKNITLTATDINGSENVGGIAGYNYDNSLIINCSVDGKVEGLNRVGGIAGYNFLDSEVIECFNKATIFGRGDFIGGLVGSNRSVIKNSYSRGDVNSLGEGVGGLVGWNRFTEILNSYSTGKVNGTETEIGGLVGGGGDETSISNSFFDIETSGQTKSAGGEGKTTNEMKDKETFTERDWNFNTIWDISAAINNGYPFLRFQQGR